MEALSLDGRGIARVNGKAVFIEGALPGEEVSFRVDRSRRRYDTGRLVELLSASPQRVDPPRCPVFGRCGGCTLQHLAPEAQLVAKQRALFDALQRIAGLAPAAELPAIAGPAWTTAGARALARG